MKEDNIAAISTALAPSGVAIIRISGSDPLSIASKMFHSKTSFEQFEPNKLYVGTIDGGNFKDHGMCVYFKAPKSYTGEDMVEFHCHGGLAITKGILETCLRNGARLADRGEFTKRAFLNGKLSLSSCEGLIDMINSQSVAEVKSGYYLYKENLFKKIRSLEDKLTYILAQIDANIDYPEDDLGDLELEKISRELIYVKGELSLLTSTFLSGSKAKNGVNVVICGRPNAGKSSLLNRLINCDKAIVTSIEGTTRDVVEGSTEINGIRFNFYDTAGIRESNDEVERLGVERSKRAINSADVVLFLIDGCAGFSLLDEEIFALCRDKQYLRVINKCDENTFDNAIVTDCDLVVSAKTGEGFDKLINEIYIKAGLDKLNLDGDYLVEKRHYEALSDAVASLNNAISAYGIMPLDVITIDIRSALLSLGLISGETADENVINEIFSKFCVGK